MAVVEKRMQMRRDTSEGWETADPVLGSGEKGYDTDVKDFKIGDGVTTWTELSFYSEGVGTPGGGGLANLKDSNYTGSVQTAQGDAESSADFAQAFGYGTGATAEASHAEGYQSASQGVASHAEGYQTGANAHASHAEGYQTTAFGDYAHSEGQSSTATGTASHAEGINTTASSSGAHAEGEGAAATNTASHAEGELTTASAYGAHAEGINTTASGEAAHAEGVNTTASGEAAHAEGMNSDAAGEGAHAEGFTTLAHGLYAHAEGGATSAIGTFSHAEGDATTASSGASHAEGTLTIAYGASAHAEGIETNALGDASHASGARTVASGVLSAAHGFESVAAHALSTAAGCQSRANWATSRAFAGGNFTTPGDAQQLDIVLRAEVVDGTFTPLSHAVDDGTYALSPQSSLQPLANERLAIAVRLLISNSDVSASAYYDFTMLVHAEQVYGNDRIKMLVGGGLPTYTSIGNGLTIIEPAGYPSSLGFCPAMLTVEYTNDGLVILIKWDYATYGTARAVASLSALSAAF